MTLLQIFVDSQYDVRSGWKFTAYSALLVGLFIATGVVVPIAVAVIDPAWLLASRDDIRFLTMQAFVLFVPSMGALLIMARLDDRSPLAAFGLTFHQRWFRDVGVGLAVAGVMVIAVIGGALLFGRVHIEWNASGLSAISATVLVLSLAAFNEEVVFRGYPLQVLFKGIGVWPAILLISCIFALLHFKNEGATVLSTLNTFVAGVFLSWAYMQTRSIWLPYGIHVGWNVGTAVVVGVPVSGIDTASILKTQLQAPMIISGGIYGPENSILGTAVFVLGVIVIRRFRMGTVSPEVQQALTERGEFVATAGDAS